MRSTQHSKIMKCMKLYTVYVVVVAWGISSCSGIVDDYKLNVTSSGPAVYGSIVTFQAQLYFGAGKTPEDEKLFRYDWKSTVDMLTERQNADFNTTFRRCFDSEVLPKKYKMTVQVYDTKSEALFKKLAQTDIDFVITSTINGNLNSNQTVHRSRHASNKTFSTQKPVKFVANLTDEFKFPPNFTYKWFIDDKLFEGSNTKIKEILIPKTGKHKVRLDVISSGITSDCKNFEYFNDLKGSFSTDLVLKDPVTDVQFYGKLNINQGENTTVLAEYSGTGPFSLCWKVVHVSTGGEAVNKTCRNGTEKSFVVLHLSEKELSKVGKYAISINLENDVSLFSRQHYLMVKEGPTPKPSSHSAAVVLIPVMSVLAVISIALFGGVFYFNYRKKKLHHIESADFEFHGSIRRTSTEGWFLSGIKDAFRSLLKSNNSDKGWERINDNERSGDTPSQTRRYGTMVSPVEA